LCLQSGIRLTLRGEKGFVVAALRRRRSKTWMGGSRLVLGPAKPHPSAVHDERSAMPSAGLNGRHDEGGCGNRLAQPRQCLKQQVPFPACAPICSSQASSEPSPSSSG
jgi:hypothetical protein